MKTIFLSILLVCAACLSAETTYTNGVFILNEDWYSHQNSTLSHLSDDGEFSYRILQAANDLPASLGCTSQFGAIYGERFYLVSKQSQDPGEQSGRRGARLVVADAATLQVAYSIDTLFALNGQSAADGRSFVGVDENKGYIGTSNGIFVLDFALGTITRRIAGTENPLIAGGETNADGVGPLYQNQIGIMLRTHDYVFAIQQDAGIHVIDPVSDTIITTLRGCYSTMTQSQDGRIWAARNTNPDWQSYPYGVMSGENWQGNELVAIDPATLNITRFDLREFCGDDNMMVEQTWYAWTAGSLCASLRENSLFFSYTDNIWDWYNGRVHIYKFDIDQLSLHEIYTTTELGDYYIYNSGALRVHPLTGNLFVGCFKSTIATNEWLFLQLTPEGELVKTYTPIRNYWYPALFIFPDLYAPEVADFAPLHLAVGQSTSIPLGKMATDRDNLEAAITKRLLTNTAPSSLAATIARDTLWLTALDKASSPVLLSVRFNSNGKCVDKTLRVSIQDSDESGVADTKVLPCLQAANGQLRLRNVLQPTQVQVCNAVGQVLFARTIYADTTLPLPQGVYLIRMEHTTQRVVLP